MSSSSQTLDSDGTEYDSHIDGASEAGTVSEVEQLDSDLPTYSVEQIADYLTDGYWEDAGITAGKINVETGGTVAVNIEDLTSYGQEIAVRALEAWEAASGFNFEYVTGRADINFDDDKSGAWAQTWVSSGGTMLLANININTGWAGYGEDYYYQTYMHEIGHALGLGHSGDYNFSASYDADADYANDSWQMSIMSYFDQNENTAVDASYAYAATPQLADTLAIQNLYGTPTNVEAGDTTYGDNATTSQYGMDLSGEYAVAIFDSGGTDTIDLRSHTQDTNLSLVAESFSDIGGKTGNLAIASNTVIENATLGSGSDVLVGNDADNYLSGGEGNDTISGGAGNDTIVAGAEDVLTGGAGADVFVIEQEGDIASDVTIVDFSVTDGDLIDLTWYFENSETYFGDALAYTDLVLTEYGSSVELSFDLDGVDSQSLVTFEGWDANLGLDDLFWGYEVALPAEILVDEGTSAMDLGILLSEEAADLSFTITGGADAALFEVDAFGTLNFVDTPDYEAAADADGDNTYNVQVSMFDGEVTTVQDIDVFVQNVNEGPEITSEDSFSIAENSTDIGQVTAEDEDGDTLSYEISGGADGNLFEIDDAGNLSFVDTPDYEAAFDLDGDNLYEVKVAVTDGDLTTTQNISVAVTDEEEQVALGGSSSGDYLIGTDADEAIYTNGGAIDLVYGGGGADEFYFGDTDSRDIVRILDYDASEGDVLNLGDAEISATQTFGSFTYVFLEGPDTDMIIMDGVTNPEAELVFA